MKRVFAFTIMVLSIVSCNHGPFKKKNEKRSFVNPISISIAANSWVMGDVHGSSDLIGKTGITNWNNEKDIIRTYFYVSEPGRYRLGMTVRMNEAPSKIKATWNDIQKEVQINSKDSSFVSLGDLTIESAGYQYVEFQGLKKNGPTFGTIDAVLIGDNIAKTKIHSIKESVYFGRRGPSVHLRYEIPEKVSDIEWFYSELEIPKGSDVIGSYFMANGFKDGYFGIQVNSEKERRILFSVWSPYKTDDPTAVPVDYRIQMLNKGANVTTGKFGNEGSGGQSYKVYPWEVGKRYGFLLRGQPAINNSTDYTAYFMDPDNGHWDLIASFRRPKGQSHLTRLYSFLENFIPNTGVLERQGGYYNQWVMDTHGNWISLDKAVFTADQTAKVKDRMDYSGGVENGGFYLKNCGFSDLRTKVETQLSRPSNHEPPIIDFHDLNTQF